MPDHHSELVERLQELSTTWQLTFHEQKDLLGPGAQSICRTASRLGIKEATHLVDKQLPDMEKLHLSRLFIIHDLLVRCFPTGSIGLWLRTPNRSLDPHGNTPLAVLVRDGKDGVASLMDYLRRRVAA